MPRLTPERPPPPPSAQRLIDVWALLERCHHHRHCPPFATFVVGEDAQCKGPLCHGRLRPPLGRINNRERGGRIMLQHGGWEGDGTSVGVALPQCRMARGRRMTMQWGSQWSIVVSSTPPPSARRCRSCLTVASNNDVNAAPRDIMSSSFKRTAMGHMRETPLLDVSTVSPHYAGALDDATTGDGGGRTRHHIRRASPACQHDSC
jgi:hypothetical protein